MVSQVSPFVHMTFAPVRLELLATRRVLTPIDSVGHSASPPCRLENILIDVALRRSARRFELGCRAMLSAGTFSSWAITLSFGQACTAYLQSRSRPARGQASKSAGAEEFIDPLDRSAMGPLHRT
jgi:hypothetical protein